MSNNKLPEGLLLNNTYQVGRCLGEGGFGITYMGYDVNLQKLVAIKEFYLAGYVSRNPYTYEVVPMSDSQARVFYNEKSKYIEEARILAKIDENPGIVKVITYFEQFGTAYIIMEFLEGRSLKAYIAERGGVLPVNEALQLMEPIIRALAIIHEKGIVHRDISPDNIMINNLGKAKLIDFGAAKTKEMDMSSNKVFKKSYSPPEQCQREGVIGPYSDVYAVCATLYELMCGYKLPSALDRQRADYLTALSDMGLDISPAINAAIISGLSLDIDARVKNATDLYYLIYVYGRDANATSQGVRNKIDESSTKILMEKIKKENTRRRYRTFYIAAVVLITLLGCGIILVRNINRRSQTPVSISGSDNSISPTGIQGAQTKYEISEDELKLYRDELYDQINVERQKQGIVETEVYPNFENVGNSCVSEMIVNKSTSQSELNSLIQKIVYSKMEEANIKGAGWLVLTEPSKFNAEAMYDEAMDNIARINGEQQGTIDLMNCNRIGISMGVHSDGTLYVVIIYN